MGMSNEPSEELKCLEGQGSVLLKASLLISIYSLYPKIVSSDAELLINELLSPLSMEIVLQTTALTDVLRRHAQLDAPAVLPSLVVHATRRSSFDAVHSALLKAFVGRAAELHDKLPTLRARATVASPPRAMSSVSPVASPEPVQVDSKYISMVTEWAAGRPERRISWEDTASGPSHMRVFEVTCCLNGDVVGIGTGAKKQIGKAQAAYAAAKFLGIAHDQTGALLLAHP